MIFLRSLLFNSVFYLSSVVIAVGAVPVLLGSPSFMRRAGAAWSYMVIWMLKKMTGTGWQIRGKDRVPDGLPKRQTLEVHDLERHRLQAQ